MKRPPTLIAKFEQWLKSNKLSQEKLARLNQPNGWTEVFPRPEGGIDEGYLVDRLWWWRAAKASDFGRIFSRNGVPDWPAMVAPVFEDHYEQSAYFYEFRARYQDRYQWEFDQPWILCSVEHWRMLDCLWPNPYPATRWLPSCAGQPEFVSLHPAKFNLKLNDSVLTEHFLEEIQRQRKLAGIAKPEPGQGARRKPISWLPIELMDRRHLVKEVLNESQRSQVSKAVRAYEQACKDAGVAP